MQTADQPKPRRGRPATGQAQTSTERNAARLARLRTAGGAAITARLGPQAARALALLRADGQTIDQAVAAALCAAAGLAPD